MERPESEPFVQEEETEELRKVLKELEMTVKEVVSELN